jgi:gluconate 2-dehydrogenase gamma chain
MSKTPGPGRGGHGLNRRQLLGSGLKAGTMALIPLVNSSCSTPPPAVSTPLGAANDSILTAFVDRIFPDDELGPAASTVGVVRYINRSLAEWNQSELPTLSAGLQALDKAAMTRHALGFAAITPEQQDALITSLEAGQLPEVAPGPALFNRLYRLTLEGLFSDPYYGGNAEYVGWDLIGYPGAVLASTPDMQKMGARLPALHTSAHGAEHDGH